MEVLTSNGTFGSVVNYSFWNKRFGHFHKKTYNFYRKTSALSTLNENWLHYDSLALRPYLDMIIIILYFALFVTKNDAKYKIRLDFHASSLMINK